MARTTSATDGPGALDSALRSLFRALETLALPDSVRGVLDQLAEDPPGDLEGAR